MKNVFLFFAILIAPALHAQQKAKLAEGPVPGSSKLSGMFSAPAGTVAVIQNNGKYDVTLTAQKENGKTFSTQTFNFPTPLLDGSKYSVTLKKIPAAQTAGIYAAGQGVITKGENMVRIGCDFTYDLVSRSSNDKGFSTFYETGDAAVGGVGGEEGRYVIFVSAAPGLAGSTGKHRQIFWRDRNEGITKLISAAPNGEEGNGESYFPAISGDGKSVAFESYSSNLVQTDKNGFRDIFVWHAATNKIETVSVGEGGTEANAESIEPSVSGDGNFIAFTSTASNISHTEKGISNNNVFLRDMKNGTTVMISIDPIAKKGGGGSKPSISYDGSRIAFYSNVPNLVANDNNGLWDIFLWYKNNTMLKRVSLTADGKERKQGSESANRIVAPTISGNGRYIAFATTADNMMTGASNNFQDVFIYDITSGSITTASNSADGKPGNEDSPIQQGEKIALSFDGNWVAFSTKASNLGVPSANIVMHNMTSGKNQPISSISGSSVGQPAISYSGSYVVFGIGGKLDSRFPSTGIFANYTGVGPCRFCPQ